MTRTEAIYAFAATLALNQISIQPAGDKFLLVFPTVQTNDVGQLLNRIKLRQVTTNTIVPPTGMVRDIGRTSLKQAVAIFQELLGKPVELASSMTIPVLLFQNQSEMKRDTLLYGLECLFGINGLFVVPNENGDGFKVVDRGQLDLKSPRAKSNSGASQ